MYPIPDAHNSLARSSKHPGRALLFSEGHFFHDLQVVTEYETQERWTGVIPKTAPELLPRTAAKLRDHKPLNLVVLGDSISTGANASGVVGAKPYTPGYPGLVARGLEARGASKVALTNLSVGGTTSSWGVTRIPNVVAARSDLVIIAFGMNDSASAVAEAVVGHSFGTSPKRYGQNTREMTQKVRQALPSCEVILVAPMIGNAEWDFIDQKRFPAFRDELRKLEAPGVAIADVTSIWAELLRRKSFHDLTGNGLNHPNDFGHAIYSQVILHLVS
jgi:lysophospholipase L1-like esterase